MAEVANFLAGLSAANLRRPLLGRSQSSSAFLPEFHGALPGEQSPFGGEQHTGII